MVFEPLFLFSKRQHITAFAVICSAANVLKGILQDLALSFVLVGNL